MLLTIIYIINIEINMKYRIVKIFLSTLCVIALNMSQLFPIVFADTRGQDLQKKIIHYTQRIETLEEKIQREEYAAYKDIINRIIDFLKQEVQKMEAEYNISENEIINTEKTEEIDLVQFGSAKEKNVFNNSIGWNTVELGETVTYTNAHGGGVLFAGRDSNDNWISIKGPARKFTVKDRLEFTWVNPSNESKSIYTVVSFTDSDGYKQGVSNQWYTGGSREHVSSNSHAKTFYDIHGEYDGKTSTQWGNSEGVYEKISIFSKQNFILKSIRIIPSDITPPNVPTNLVVTDTRDNSISLQWDKTKDAELYYIYRNDKQVGVSKDSTFIDYNVIANTDYSYQVTALDKTDFGGWKKYNESDFSKSVDIKTLVFNQASYLINPEKDFEYKGAFRLPGQSGNSQWEYGGGGLTFDKNGDNSNDDQYPGALIGLGHVYQMPSASKITIPTPVISSNVQDLPVAQTIVPFTNLREANFSSDFFPRPFLIPVGDVAMLNDSLYYSLASLYHFGSKYVSIGRIDRQNFLHPEGMWFIGDKKFRTKNSSIWNDINGNSKTMVGKICTKYGSFYCYV